MNKKSKYILFIFVGLIFILSFELIYLNSFRSVSEEELIVKNSFVKITGLPDLALSTESSYIRHRSLSSIGDIYSEDGTLREFSKASFTTTSIVLK